MAMASLTSSLIARKGAARPSAPSPGFGKSLLPQDQKDGQGEAPSEMKPTDMAETLASITSFTEYAKSRKEPDVAKAPAKAESPNTILKAKTAAYENADLPHLYNGRVKKTLRLDVDTHQALLDLAHEEGRTQQFLMQRAVEELLKK